LFLQLGFQPGSPGQIISLRAVGDGDFHGEFPWEKYWLMVAERCAPGVSLYHTGFK
jgi:hypothetical protein